MPCACLPTHTPPTAPHRVESRAGRWVGAGVVLASSALCSHSLPRRRLLAIGWSSPPLGRRVRVRNLHALLADLFVTAAHVLRPGGRMVLINPLRAAPPRGDERLALETRRTVDLGLRHATAVEVWRRSG